MELIIQSKLNQEAIDAFDSMNKDGDDEIIVFVDYAEQDVPLGTDFGGVKLISCVNQFDYNFDEVPKGWQTICKFRIADYVKERFDELPEKNGWQFDKKTQIILDHNTYREGRLKHLLDNY